MTTDHVPYLAAVQDALIGAGLETLSEHAEDHDPRGGGIQIDTHGPNLDGRWLDFDEVWLSWNEDHGWVLDTMEEQPDGRDPKRFVFDLDLPRLPSPYAVVQTVAAAAGIDLPPQPDGGFPDLDFPQHTFEDDDIPFEQALARYAEQQ